MLENIDSLMWVQADSALKVMLEFAGSEAPWSFTPVWYWDSVLHVQDRWETKKQGRQFLQSHCWDTTLVVLDF